MSLDDPDELTPTPEDLGFTGITSRFSEIEGVVIDPQKVPERLRHLIPYALHWCIGDDVERSDLMWLTPYEELKAFVLAVNPWYEEINAWRSNHRNDVPIPDEIVVFDMMIEAFRDAEACHVDVES